MSRELRSSYGLEIPADWATPAMNPDNTELEVTALHTAADLLERHDECEISLNRWTWPGALVSLLIGRGVLKNDLHPVFPDEVDCRGTHEPVSDDVGREHINLAPRIAKEGPNT